MNKQTYFVSFLFFPTFSTFILKPDEYIWSIFILNCVSTHKKKEYKKTNGEELIKEEAHCSEIEINYVPLIVNKMNGKLNIDHRRSLKCSQSHWLHTGLASAERTKTMNQALFLAATKS